MAYITLNKTHLEQNYRFLQSLFEVRNIEWAPVLKLLCGNEKYLKYVLALGDEQVCDARLSNLKMIKKIKPAVETIYIKPPPKKSIANVIKYCDVSFNSEYVTIKWLSDEAKKQNKIHRIIIMIELGDLREGILGEHLIAFYEKIFQLPNIKVAGIGANLNCLSGVMPSQDKLIQLSLYKQLLELKFNQKIEWVSGGSSVMLPLLLRNLIPKAINNFRIGETLFFGNDLFSNEIIRGMNDDVFLLHSEIIEITKKPIVPYGLMQETPSGDTIDYNEADFGKKHKRAILDIGLLDVADISYIRPLDKDIRLIGGSSDMTIADIDQCKKEYKVGDIVPFKIKYMAALRLMNSSYIDKELIE